MPRSWVGWLNFLVLQWFCVRLVRRFTLTGVSLGFGLLYWVIPLTGWRSNLVFIGR